MATELAQISANFVSSLATKVAVGDTTATLVSITDADGTALPNGRYFFTVDKDGTNQEHISCTITGTAVTAVKTITRTSATETSGFALAHNRGESITITDFAIIKKMLDLLDGTTDFDASTPLGYDGTATISSDNQFVTKKYADDQDETLLPLDGSRAMTGELDMGTNKITDVVDPTSAQDAATKAYADALAIAGSPNASPTAKGVVEIATQAEVDAGTDTGGTGATNVVTPSTLQAYVAAQGSVLDTYDTTVTLSSAGVLATHTASANDFADGSVLKGMFYLNHMRSGSSGSTTVSLKIDDGTTTVETDVYTSIHQTSSASFNEDIVLDVRCVFMNGKVLIMGQATQNSSMEGNTSSDDPRKACGNGEMSTAFLDYTAAITVTLEVRSIGSSQEKMYGGYFELTS